MLPPLLLSFHIQWTPPALRVQGKPAMTRSVLQREEAAAEGGSKEDEEDELAAYLARIDATFGRE